MNGENVEQAEFRALQTMVILIAQTLRKSLPFREHFEQGVKQIGASPVAFPSEIPEVSDHYTAEFHEHWRLLSQLVLM